MEGDIGKVIAVFIKSGRCNEIQNLVESQITLDNTEAMVYKASALDEQKWGFKCLDHTQRKQQVHYWYFKAVILGNKNAKFCLMNFHKRHKGSYCGDYCVNQLTKEVQLLHFDHDNYWVQKYRFGHLLICPIVPQFVPHPKATEVRNEKMALAKCMVNNNGDMDAAEYLAEHLENRLEAFKYYKQIFEQSNNKSFYFRVDLRKKFEGVEEILQCQGVCMVFIAIRKYRCQTLLSDMPKDIVLLISKYIWKIRYTWTHEKNNNKKIKNMFYSISYNVSNFDFDPHCNQTVSGQLLQMRFVINKRISFGNCESKL